MGCTQLTYRGTTYKKLDNSEPAINTWKRITSDAPHIYRGKRYHYESKKKVVA